MSIPNEPVGGLTAQPTGPEEGDRTPLSDANAAAASIEEQPSSEEHAPVAETPYRRPLNPLPYPYFSQQERARRWELTREAMAARDIDCLIVPNNTGRATHLQAVARYLTHVGGGGDADVAAVFPLDGEPAAVVTNRDRWVHTQPWCHDLREARRSYGAGALEKLRELPVAPRRIGVVGLSRTSSSLDGAAGNGFMTLLMQAFESADWVDFTPDMESIRIVKSAEEIAFLERAALALDGAIQDVKEALRPGAATQQLWGTFIEGLCRHGSELPVEQRWAAGTHPQRLLPRPSFDQVEPGWLLRLHAEAAWGGYRAPGARTLACGAPDPVYLELARLIADVWGDVVAGMRAGVQVRDVVEAVPGAAARYAPRTGPARGAEVSLALRGCGLGADAPVVGGSLGNDADLQRTIEPGWCMSLRVSAGVGARRLSWGDAVVVEPGTVRRLGTTQPGIAIAPA